MKKLISLLIPLFVLGCSHSAPVMFVEGTCPHTFDGMNIYMVPRPHPTEETVIKAVVKDGRFAFKVPADSGQMYHISISKENRNYYQQLLVALEPGNLKVHIDTIRYSGGTPLNDARNRWKENMAAIGDLLSVTESEEIRDSLDKVAHDCTRDFILANPNFMGGFILSSQKNAFDSAEFTLFKDTGVTRYMVDFRRKR